MFNAPVSDLDEGGFTAPPEDLSGGFNAPAEDLAPQSEIPQLKPWNPTLLDRLQQFGQNIRQSGPVESLLGPTDQEKAGQPVASNPNRISTEGLLGALSSDEKTTALGESAANLLKTVSSNQPQNIILDHVAKLGGVVGGSAQVAQGIHDAVLDFVGHMAVDPRNYLLGMGFLSKYPALARTVSGVFGAQMAAQVPAAAQAAGAASVDGTPREQAAAYANLGISTAFPLLAGVHAAHGETAPPVNHTLPGQFKPAAPLDNSEPFSTPNADAILSQNNGQIPTAFTPLNEDTSTTVEQPPTQPSAPPPPIRPPTKPVIAPPAEDILSAANIQPPTQNASEIPISTRLPESEVRPPVGEAPPLRQQGEVAAARPEELAPQKSTSEPINALTPEPSSKSFFVQHTDEDGKPAFAHAENPTTLPKATVTADKLGGIVLFEGDDGNIHPVSTALPSTPKGEQVVLQPALLVNGKPITGGATHAEILGTITAQAKSLVTAGKRDEGIALLDAGIEANNNDAQHVFVDRTGKVFDRTQAAAALGRTGELQSQDLPVAKPIIPEIPLGLHRPSIQNPALRLMSDAEFNQEHKAAQKAVDAGEKQYDEAGESFTPEQRANLAQVQDRWEAASLERFRRNNLNTVPADLLRELRDNAHKAALYGKDTEWHQKGKLIIEELVRQGAAPESLLAELKLKSPDEAEVFAADMADIKKLAEQPVEPLKQIAAKPSLLRSQKISALRGKIVEPLKESVPVQKDAVKGNPKVGELFAREGDYEFGLTRGGLAERPEMYGVGMRRAGSNGEFESGGYGYHMKPEGVIERWANKEVARGSEPTILHPKAQSIWDEEHAAFTKTANEKAAADRSKSETDALKASQWAAYSKAVDETKLPTGKRGEIEVPANKKDGTKASLKLTGTRYGDWFINKDENKHVSEPYYVSHVKSGLKAGKFATLEQAKTFIKALLHASPDTNFKDAVEFAANKPNSQKIVQVAKAQMPGGEVPDFFKPTAIPKPVEGVKESLKSKADALASKLEPPQSEGGQSKPVEPVKPSPVTPEAKQPTALETINTSPKVSVKLPEGATMVRTTIKYKDREIQKVISKKDLEKFNPFAGSENVKLEAGTIRSGGMFSPVRGKVEIRSKESPKPTTTFAQDENKIQSTEALAGSKSVRDVRDTNALVSVVLDPNENFSELQRASAHNIKPVEGPIKQGASGLEADAATWRAIAKSFSVRVVALDMPEAFSGTHGITTEKMPGVLFVNARTPRAFHAIVGHELLHDIQNRNPQLYIELFHKIKSLVKDPEFSEFITAKQRSGITDPNVIREELAADLFERSFNDPSFWSKLAAKEPTFFEKLATVVIDFLNRITQKLHDNGVYKYFTDVGKAHDAIAQTLADFKRLQGESGKPSGTGTVTFSRDENVDPSMEDFIKSTVAPSDEQAFHQTAGVPNLGTEYKPERIQATREAVQQTRFSAEGPITEAKVGEFYRLLQEFTDKPTRRQAMDSLVADVKSHTGDETGELAPALLYAELRDFAAKMLLRGDVTPLFKIRSLSNEFATIAGEVTSAGARAMRGLQEGEGKTLLKSLYELTNTRLKEDGQKLGVSDELYQQLVDSLDNAEVDKKDLENTITTGKNTEGKTIDDILGTAKPEEVAKTKLEREARAKQELDSDAEKSAKKIINDLQLKRGAEWLKPEVPRGRVDEIKEFAKNYLKGRLPDDPLKDPMNPEEDYQRPQPGSTLSDIEARKVADELEKLGVTPNSAIVLAHELIQEREVKFGNDRLNQMRKAANSRSVKSLVESILGTPLRAQSDPAWVKATAMHWFEDNGLAKDQAEAAYKIFNKQFQDAFVRAQEKIAKSILKSGEAKTLDAVVKQIRSGLFDPSHPGFEPFSAKIGLKGMPKADLEKLAELDEKLSKGLESMPEVVMMTDHMLAIFRRNKMPPGFWKTLSSNYAISQLSGIRTMTIHAFAGVAHLFHERVLGTLSTWPTATNAAILWRPIISSTRKFVDQLRFGFGAGHSYFPMRELEAGEDVLRQHFEQGYKEFQSGDMKTRGVGLLRMIAGLQNFTMRLLNALNQANIIAVRDAQLPLFGSMAFKELGLNPKHILVVMDKMPIIRNRAYTDAIDRGFSPLHARIISYDIEQQYLAQFFAEATRSPELKDTLLKGSHYEAMSIVGRLAKEVREDEEGGVASRLGLHALIKMTGQMSHTPQGRIGKLYMFGYVAVPTRMARFEAWNSAYGLIRLGIDKFRTSRGWESWWKQSLATKQQREYRLRMALAATAVQGLLLGGLVAGGAALLGRRSTADPDAGKDKFAWYITGNGPQNKDLRDAWSHMGFQPNSIVLALNGKVHVAIPITRVGETLGHMLWGYSAADDYAWRKKEAEAHGKIDPTTGAYVPGKFGENAAVTAFQAIGNYASIIGERGPLQTVLQMGRGNESPQIALASAAGKLLAPAVPFAGLQRSVRDMIVGQVDYSTPESAFEANFPVLGWTGSTQAINRLGDPLYDHSWYAKIARTGLPIAVGVADTSENQELYTAILNQGVAIPALSRTRIEDEYGQLTQDQWNLFAKTSGTTLKSSLLSNLNTLQNTDPADARKLVSINANAADATAARSMGLEKQSSSRSSGATASAAPSSGLPRQTRPNSLRSGLRPHSRVHRVKLNHAGRMTSGLRHRTGSLLRGRRNAYV